MTGSGHSHDENGQLPPAAAAGDDLRAARPRKLQGSEHEATQGVSAALLRPLATVLTRLGRDGDAFLAELGLRADMPADTYVTGDLVDGALERIAAARADPVFGITMARTASASPLGLFGHMVWSSGTIGDAIARAARLYAVVSRRTRLEVLRTPGGVVLRQGTIAGVSRGPILTEFVFASFALRARAATDGRFAVGGVELRHGRVDHPAYREVFRAPVTFESSADQLVFDPDQLDLPLVTADALTSSSLESVAERLAASGDEGGLPGRVERALDRRLGAPVTIEDVAAELGISERTLRRELVRHGTSFRALLDQARRRYADESLARGRAMKAIALELGFSDPSAFSRAYKRWTGRPRNGKPT